MNCHENSLPLWHHHRPVVLPVVFFCADGCFIDGNERISRSSPGQFEASFKDESAYLNDVARIAHSLLLEEHSATDVVQYVLNELSQNHGRWTCGGETQFYQSAFIMNGNTKKAGAVAYYRSNTVHAVDAARFVLDKTKYNFICGETGQAFIEQSIGAEESGDGRGMEKERSDSDSYVFDKSWPLSLYVIAADKSGNISCGSFDEQHFREQSADLSDSVLLGSGVYADSNIGSAIACSLNKNHKASGSCLAWQTTQLMRDHAAAPKPSTQNGITQPQSSLSLFLSNSLSRYADEGTVIFALHNSGALPNMKMSIFSFVAPQPGYDSTPNLRKCAALSLVGGGVKGDGQNFFHWSSLMPDLRRLSSSSLFDVHPHGNSNGVICNPEIPLSTEENRNYLVVLVHGGSGSGSLASEFGDQFKEGVQKAVLAGYRTMAYGNGTAVQAVREAVHLMENQWVFNAGCGSYLTRSGHVEMDAMLQDGATGRFGAVCGVRRVRHAVDVCAAIKDDCDNEQRVGGQILAGDCATEYAEERGIGTCDESELVSEKATKALAKWKQEPQDCFQFGTVGAVAIDRAGNVAAATSSGGVTGKIDGRIGDTPMPGCGNAADNRLGAVSGSGKGEHIMATCTARACMHFLDKGNSAQEAADKAVEHLHSSWHGTPGGGKGGIICVSPSPDLRNNGTMQIARRWGFSFNTKGMCWAVVDESAGNSLSVQYGLAKGEICSKPVPSSV